MGRALIVAVVVGAFVAIQVGVVGRTGDRFSLLAVSTVLQAGGLIAGVVWITVRSEWGEVASIARLWWWVPLGVVGWLLVAGLGFASAKAGVAVALAVALTSQLGVGLAIDSAAGRRVGVQALVGLALLVGGAVLITTRPVVSAGLPATALEHRGAATGFDRLRGLGIDPIRFETSETGNPPGSVIEANPGDDGEVQP